MTKPEGGKYLSVENLVKFKVLALLHDPPYKALLLSSRIEKDKTITGSKAHENEVRGILDILASLLGNTICYVKHYRVKLSDTVASSFDRWEIDNLKHHGHYIRSYFGLGLVNIFEPSIMVNLNNKANSISKNGIIELFSELKLKICTRDLGTNSIKLLHIFETIYEPLWYKQFPETVNPADTRVPTHSIFDHLYATASTVNIAAPAGSGETVAGLMVGVSAGPLRDWLAGSRKLSDLWIASWLASIMVWYMVKDLVWCLGPDVLLLPGFRWNQLYYALLKEKLGEDYRIVKDFVEGFGFFEGFPYYAWQPAYQVLFLPIIRKHSQGNGACSEVYSVLHSSNSNTRDALSEVKDRIEGYLRDRYRRAWRLVVKAVRENAPGRLRELIDRLEDMGLLEEPPLEPVIVVKELHVSGKKNYREAKKVYAEKFNELSAEMEAKEASVLPGWARNRRLHEITRRIGTPIHREITGRADEEIEAYRWRSCSVCKHAPAVLWVPGRDLPGGEVSDDYKEWVEEILCTSEEDSGECWRKWRPVFRPGERLCPYCLVKRLLGLNEVFADLGEKLLGIRPDKEVSFPSTSDVAGLALKIALLELASMIVSGEITVPEIGDDILSGLAVELRRSSIHEGLRRTLGDMLSGGNVSRDDLMREIDRLVNGRWWTPRLLWYSVRGLYNKLHNNSIEDWRLKFAAAVLLFVDAELEEALYDNPGAQAALKKLDRILRDAEKEVKDTSKLSKIKVIREAITSPRKYYSIIWFDGDKYGLLKRGILGTDICKDVDEINVRDYLRKLFDTVYSDTRSNKRVEASKKIIKEYLEGNISPCGSLVTLCLSGDIPCGSIIVSPAYHYALANAISYTNLRAAIVAERLGGIPVYMAGDEGLIIAPTWLPWELLPDRVREGYRREVERALGFTSGERDSGLGEFVSSNPALTISLLVRRIYWASSSRVPGFHPVKKRGTGRVYWRIPAIVSNGLSMGIRFAHYKDMMYDELWLARYLLEEAKGTMEAGLWVGDSVALSYGRPGHVVLRKHDLPGKVFSKIPSSLKTPGSIVERVRSAGLFLAAVNVLVGLVEKGVVSSSVFGDRELLFGGHGRAEHVWSKAFSYGEAHVRNLVEYLFSRNIQARGQEKNRYLGIIDSVFARVLETSRSAGPEVSETIFDEVFSASHMALRSMRRI